MDIELRKSADEKSSPDTVLETVLNGLDAMIYVIVPETGEILFINDIMKVHFKITNGIGDFCYKVFQRNMHRKCANCPCHQLDNDANQSVVWEDYSSITNRHYRNTGRYTKWLDGRQVLINQAIDITDAIKVEKELNERDNLLEGVNQAAATLLSAHTTDDIENSLKESMRFVGESMDADGAHLWRIELADDNIEFLHSYSWRSEANKLEDGRLNKLKEFGDIDISKWIPQFVASNYYCGPVSKLDKSAQQYYRNMGITSIFLQPLFVDGLFWGIFCIDYLKGEHDYTKNEIRILQSVGLMVTNALKNVSLSIEIKEAHERSLLMLDTSPICAQIWDRNLNTIDCNEEAVRLYGFKDKKEYARRFLAECSPEFQPDGRRSDEKAVELVDIAFLEGYCRFEWEHRIPYSNAAMPAEVTLVRAKYANEDVVIGYTRDLREYKAQLEKIEKTQNSLRKARDIAENANRAKTNFLASMSHEIRTPMNSIIGFTELLLEEDTPLEQAGDYLKNIRMAGDVLLNLINDILDISKIESGKLVLIPIRYDMASMLNDIITLNLIRISEKPIKFKLDINDDLFSVMYGDDLRLKQILNNLLSNAFKYTHSGSVTLSVRSTRENENNIRLDFTVTDTGVGIRPEDIKHIFNDYNRVNDEANRAIEGTGLGLTLTKKLIKLMGGEISVESKFGIGSIFRASVLQKFVSSETIGAQTAKNLRRFKYSSTIQTAQEKLKRIDLRWAKVLVVDDSLVNLDLAKGIMEKYKMQVDCVTSGPDAIERVRHAEFAYDAIFMDHMMPGMDGIETAKHIRAIPAEYTRMTPIIAMTANAVMGNEQMFFNEGFQAFIPKPINIMKLDSVIRQWVAKEFVAPTQPAGLAAASSGPEQDQLPGNDINIPGVDTKTGLDLYGGSLEIYLIILKSFVENIPAELSKMCTVTKESLPTYAVIAHAMKGNSSGIGAKALSEKAAELESMAKEGDLAGVLKLNDAFIKEAQAIVENVSVWLYE